MFYRLCTMYPWWSWLLIVAWVIGLYFYIEHYSFLAWGFAGGLTIASKIINDSARR